MNKFLNYPSGLFLLDVDMTDSNFTQGEMVQAYDALVHFEGLIVNWIVKLNPNFIVVWEVENGNSNNYGCFSYIESTC